MKTLFFSSNWALQSNQQPISLTQPFLDHRASFVQPLGYTYQLRICNAFAGDEGFDVYRGKTEKLTSYPLVYKQCQDFEKIQIEEDDKLTFSDPDRYNGGTFTIKNLPQNDSLLLLVVSRHDHKSTAVKFESHFFGEMGEKDQTSQIAVMDTYDSNGKSTHPSLRIEDHNSIVEQPRIEDLRFHNVVALTAGHYRLVLANSKGDTIATANLRCRAAYPYVVLRVGELGNNNYPEDLLVYPETPNAAFTVGLWVVLLTLLF
jgi:hypothetical protein